jgi:hypothetical protein
LKNLIAVDFQKTHFPYKSSANKSSQQIALEFYAEEGKSKEIIIVFIFSQHFVKKNIEKQIFC